MSGVRLIYETAKNFYELCLACWKESAVSSQLALWGYDANMTLGRTKNVDIIVSDPRTNRFFQIEVKQGNSKVASVHPFQGFLAVSSSIG